MSLGAKLLVVAIFVVFVLSLFFIFCRRYEDGIIGNAALGPIAFACGWLLWDAWEGDLQVPAPAFCLFVVAVAIFKARHAWRFFMFHWYGWFRWKRPSDGPAADPEAEAHSG